MNKVNVVILGINSSLRRRVECSLLENVEIIAYSDSDKLYKSCKRFGYKQFWYIDILAKKESLFDYVIVCEHEYIKWLKKEKMLIKMGVPYNKILPTLIYDKGEEPVFDSMLDRFIKLDRKFDGLCFGMCYSKWGFWEHFMPDDWLKLSMNGADLNVHYIWLQYLFTNHLEKMSTVKNIILELPYYAFDWDMQCSGQVYFRMLQYDTTDNFSTFLAQKEDAKTYIERYRQLKKIAKDQLGPNYTGYVYSDIDISKTLEYENQQVENIDMIWQRDFEDSRKNNELYLKRFCELCVSQGIKVYICVFPLSKPFRNIHADKCNKKKEYFYKTIDKLGLRKYLFDFNDNNCFEEKEFKDLTHLNGKGAEKLTIMIKQMIYDDDI